MACGGVAGPALVEISDDGGRAARAAPFEQPQRHRRQLLCLVDDEQDAPTVLLLLEKETVEALHQLAPRAALGLETEAEHIEDAVYGALEAGHRTGDIAGPDDTPLSTSQMGDAILERL